MKIAEFITPQERILEELVEIDRFLSLDCATDQINELAIYGETCSQYIVRTGKLVADSKYHFNTTIKSDIISMLERIARETPHATATTINKIVSGLCRDEQFLVDYASRMNAAATHRQDWIRSLLSKEKELMKLGHF